MKEEKSIHTKLLTIFSVSGLLHGRDKGVKAVVQKAFAAV